MARSTSSSATGSSHTTQIDEIVTLEDGDMVADTAQVTYRFNMTTPDGPRTAEQHVFYRTEGDQITYARAICSGFRPL